MPQRSHAVMGARRHGALAFMLLGGVLGLAACGGGSGGGGGSSMPTAILTPVQVTAALAFTEIGVGRGHACAVGTNGGTYCWGQNEHGVLGSTATMSVCVLPIGEGGSPPTCNRTRPSSWIPR